MQKFRLIFWWCLVGARLPQIFGPTRMSAEAVRLLRIPAPENLGEISVFYAM